ncbi:MAG: Fic family protein [Puniceicoccales bacterium]|jgi:Fic family protein|nr:Fic family protein [Puniceicoccales bacterium]
MERTGSYKTHKVGGETYESYVPVVLPVEIDLKAIHPALERSMVAIAKLNGMVHLVPNLSLFLYMYVRKEAVLSSQIEGTQSSLNDLILFENGKNFNVDEEDVASVSNYVKALTHGANRIKGGFALSLRLMREIHGILLEETRGKFCLPGEFRRSQNWVGGTRPGNAFFVPPTPDDMLPALDNLEKYLHDESIPVLVRAGVAHLEFETIHPFLDGNGRIGRLLISLMLHNFKLLDVPILYPSLYFKQNRSEYYALLNLVRERGNWEDWLNFFLNGMAFVANDAISVIGEINALFAECERKINAVGRGRFSCLAIFERAKRVPQVSSNALGDLKLSQPTVRIALKTLEVVGIFKEISGKKRNKTYVFKKYLDILSS